jgi:hypothetical protein
MIQQVMQQTPEDPDTAIKTLKQRGFFGAATGLQKIVTEERTKMVELRGKEAENEFKRGQISAQQAEAEFKALTRNREEDWAELYLVNPEQAMKMAPFMLGSAKFIEWKDKQEAARVAAENAARDDERALRGQDITVRGQDLGAETSRRGQDMSASTAAANRAAANARAAAALQAGGGGTGGVSPAMVQSILKNPNLFNGLTATLKEKLIVPLTEAGFDFSQNTVADGKPSNGLEKRALNFFNRAKQADEDLDKIEAAIAASGTISQMWRENAPNFLQSTTGQMYTQSQRAFTEARLRKDSGAAIPPHEYQNDQRTYFVQAGDDPATVDQKQRARAALLASLGFESGRALPEFYGDDAKALIEDYKGRAKGTPKAGAAAGPKEGDKKPITAPGYPAGAEATFTGGKWLRTK